MQTSKSSAKPNPSGISRRTVVKGAAWAVPAITVASAVPAMAASGQECITVTWSGAACKYPGLSDSNLPKAYQLEFVFTNGCENGGCVNVVVTDVYKPHGSDRNLYLAFDSANPPELSNPYTPPSTVIAVCAGTPKVFTMPTTYSYNSSEGITIAFTVNGTPQSVQLTTPTRECPA